MRLMDIVDSEVELQGGEDVAGVDSYLVLASHQSLVQVSQLLVQLFLQEDEVVGWRVLVGDVGPKELAANSKARSGRMNWTGSYLQS